MFVKSVVWRMVSFMFLAKIVNQICALCVRIILKYALNVFLSIICLMECVMVNALLTPTMRIVTFAF